MGLVNLGVFRGVETHRGVEGDDCASSLTTRFFSQVFLQRNPGRAGLGCKISGFRRDDAEGSQRLIVSLGREQQGGAGLLHA